MQPLVAATKSNSEWIQRPGKGLELLNDSKDDGLLCDYIGVGGDCL